MSGVDPAASNRRDAPANASTDFAADRYGGRVVVVGGGISGLAAASRLVELRPSIDLRVLDAGDRLGGVLHTIPSDGFLFEDGPDNFVTNVPWGLDLCRKIGLADQLLETNDTHRRAFVVHRGKLRIIPPGFLVMAPSRIWPLLSTPILSPLGKLRLAWEYFTPAKTDDSDESLASFVTRRLGRETYERLVQPLVCGIYSADPEKLSIQAAMGRFVEMEREHGGLIKAVRRQARAARARSDQASGARYSLFTTLRDGVGILIQKLADRLPAGAVQLNAPVVRITPRTPRGWTVEIGGSAPETVEADAVVAASPAYRAADLIAAFDPHLAEQLQKIPYNSCALVSLGYRRDQIGHPMDGFGFVVPIVERRRLLSASFCSVKYPGRAPEGFELLRVFIGGALQSQLVELPDDRLQAVAEEELADLLDLRGRPVCCRISRTLRSMPQYNLGHGRLVEQIDAMTQRWPGLALAGNAYQGVGIPHCIHSGEQAAQRVAAAVGHGAAEGEE